MIEVNAIESPPRWRAWAAALTLVLFEFGLLRGYRRHLDLNIWDESHYLRQGLHLLAREWEGVDYAWSLPLTSIYAALSLLPDVGWMLPDIVFGAVALAVVLSVWWALRSFLPELTAVLVAAWIGGSVQILSLFRQPMVTGVYGLGLVLFALAIGFAARQRWIAMAAVLVVACLNRAEVGAVMALGGLLLLVWPDRTTTRAATGEPRSWLRTRWPGAMLFLLGGGFTAAMQLGWRSRSRAWFAFRQHFAMGAQERMAPERLGPPGVSGFAFPAPWIEHYFGEAHSVGEAIATNSNAFREHVLHNIGLLGRLADESLRLSLSHLVPRLPALIASSIVLLSAVGALVLLVVRRREWRTAALPIPNGAAALCAGTLVLLLPALLLRPRTDLAIPLVLAVGIGVASLATVLWRWLLGRLARDRGNLAPWARISLAAAPLVGLVLIAWIRPSPFQRGPNDPLPYRSAVDILSRRFADGPAAQFFSAEAHQLVTYAGLDQLTPLNASDARFMAEHEGTRFRALAAELDFDYAMLLPSFYSLAEAYPGVLETLRSGEWERIEVGDRAVLFQRARNSAE